MCARVCRRAHTHPRRHMRAPSVGVDRVWLGSQALYGASAFNANIGAWNTARVTTLYQVCAGFSARAAHPAGGVPPQRDALGGSSVRRGPLCAAALPMRARVCAQTCGHAHVRASTCVGIAARSNDGIYVCMYVYVYLFMYIYVCMQCTYIYI
jgi:hypothetical protein